MGFRVTAKLKCGNVDPPIITQIDFVANGTGAEAWRSLVDRASALSASILESRIVSDVTGVVHLTQHERPLVLPKPLLPSIIPPTQPPTEEWPTAGDDNFHQVFIQKATVKEYDEHASFT